MKFLFYVKEVWDEQLKKNLKLINIKIMLYYNRIERKYLKSFNFVLN